MTRRIRRHEVPTRSKQTTGDEINVDDGLVLTENGMLGPVSEVVFLATARHAMFGHSLRYRNGVLMADVGPITDKSFVAKKYADRDMILVGTTETPPALDAFSR